MSESAPPLKLTGANLFIGAGWTLLFFVLAVTWITGAITTVLFAMYGPSALAMGLIGAGFGLVLSSAVGGIATLLVGVPLTLGVATLLRGSRSVRVHVWGAAGAGALSAAVVVVGYLVWFRLTTFIGEPLEFDATSLPLLAAAVAVTVVSAASAAAGWLTTLHTERSREDSARLRAVLNEPY